MKLTMLKGKIHRATVTDANLDYEGSVTIDAALLEAAGILPYERVEIYDVTRGTRLATYAIEGSVGAATSASTAPPRTWCARGTSSSSPPTPR